LFWCAEARAQPHRKELILPTGTVELVVSLRPDAAPLSGGAIVCGPHSQSFRKDTSQSEKVIGVHFKAGRAFPFLGAKADELHSSIALLESLWGRDATRLRERLLEVPSSAARFAVIEQTLLKRLATAPKQHSAVGRAVRQFESSQGLAISVLARQIGLSSRRFAQLFSREVGMTPKRFCRVRRFQETLKHVEASRIVDWAGLALQWGYFDQAHLANEFRALCSLSPTEYLQRRGSRLYHVPLS
jgi:AraC-like DNA-binding protein